MSAQAPSLYRDAHAFAKRVRRTPRRAPGVPRCVFLVAPAEFRIAAESASDNRYMRTDLHADPLRALLQQQALAQALARAGIATVQFPGHPDTPDAVFPNNVYATAPGCLLIGAMRHGVRQLEAERPDIRAFFTGVLGYRELDLSGHGWVAELTGSLVIDRARNLGYCGLSERCDAAGAAAMAQGFGLDAVLLFDLAPGEYHTNVVMSALDGRGVLLCPEGFADANVAAAIASGYPDAAIQINAVEKQAFVGNCIALGHNGLWMSACAEQAMCPATRAAIAALGLDLHSVNLDEIEKAGGSLRCMIGEIY